ncbi:MAG: hypothetical protein J5584_07265 [Clostridia bacterium]|nr:hypothetical protein [Clostridia bacterium]
MKSYNTKIIKNAFKRMVEEHGPEVFDVAGEPETLVDYLPDDAKYNVVRMAFRMGCYRRLQELKKQYGRFELAQNPLNTELKSFGITIEAAETAAEVTVMAAEAAGLTAKSAGEEQIMQEAGRFRLSETPKTVFFGTYPQSSTGERAPIEWRIIGREGNKVWLTSEYALDFKPFTTAVTNNWAVCTLRQWLNDAFINNAFTNEQQNRLLTIQESIKNWRETEEDPEYLTLEYKVSLPGLSNIDQLFTTDKDRIATVTDYAEALADKSYENIALKNQIAKWWIANNGNIEDSAYVVSFNGEIEEFLWGNEYRFVRPLVLVALDNDEIEELDKKTQKAEQMRKEAERLRKEAALLREQREAEARKVFITVAGRTVTFGIWKYKANGEKANIEWQVLKTDGNKALIVSKQGLDCIRFNLKRNKKVAWEDSSLREWLNDTFYNEAFTDEQKKRIKSSTVRSDGNGSKKVPETETTDNVFVLSVSEVKEFFNKQEERTYTMTEYVESIFAKTNSTEFRCWLRTPGKTSYFVETLYVDGHIFEAYQTAEGSGCVAVRPAMWIELDAEEIDNINRSIRENEEKEAREKEEHDRMIAEAKSTVKLTGDTVIFGAYPKGPDNVEAPVEWQILKRDGNKALLLSKFALFKKKYQSKAGGVTWDCCSLRTWLNGSFIKNSFSKDGRARILETEVLPDTDSNPTVDERINAGEKTVDKIFLLSFSEVCEFFPEIEARGCLNFKGRDVGWLTRTPGVRRYIQFGKLVELKECVLYSNGVAVEAKDEHEIRPAMWITLDGN